MLGPAALLAAVAWGVVGAITAPRAPSAPRVAPHAFHVSYAVTTTIQGSSRATTRDVWVERPWRSRVEEHDAAGRRISLSVNSPDHYVISSGDRLLDLGAPDPGPPPSDYHLDAVLPDLLRWHLAVRLGTRRVAGEPCVVYRTGGPLGEAFTAATAQEHADLCVTADGILLLEDWWRDGSVLRRTEATALVRGPVDPALFAEPAAQPVDASFQPSHVQPLSTRQLPHDTGRYWLARHPPWGLRLFARYRAQASAALDGGGAVSNIDVYRHGDVIVVLFQQPAGASTGSGPLVELPPLGAARATLQTSGPQLHVVSQGIDLVLRSTMSLTDLEWFARSLEAVPVS